MKELILELLNKSNQLSSKRFIALYCLLLLTIVTIAILCGVSVPNELIYSLVALIGGSSAMTLKEKQSPNIENIN